MTAGTNAKHHVVFKGKINTLLLLEPAVDDELFLLQCLFVPSQKCGKFRGLMLGFQRNRGVGQVFLLSFRLWF